LNKVLFTVSFSVLIGSQEVEAGRPLGETPGEKFDDANGAGVYLVKFRANRG